MEPNFLFIDRVEGVKREREFRCNCGSSGGDWGVMHHGHHLDALGFIEGGGGIPDQGSVIGCSWGSSYVKRLAWSPSSSAVFIVLLTSSSSWECSGVPFGVCWGRGVGQFGWEEQL